ncbi:MAG: hypothetical protein IT338_20290 [Thermomicrobiales bacterium]|nr:hypothetical protein [Thermomicrobiales bacterium]
MSGYIHASREGDPVHTVRTIGRLAQMIIELRDEYVARPRPDLLVQIDQRVTDLIALQDELRARMADAAQSHQE